jgi:dimethylamine monooxygenase subunit A
MDSGHLRVPFVFWLHDLRMSFDFTAVQSPFRMQPGLRKLAAGAAQLTPNRLGDRALREKLAVLFSHASQALLSAPHFDAAPALQALCAHAAAEHPAAFSVDELGHVHAHQLGWSLHGQELHHHPKAAPEIGACLAALSPSWRLAGLLSLAFAEDFAVIDGSTAHIPWMAVCLPSHWAPETKVGRHFAEVHAPVADNQMLITASAHLARLVTGADRWERYVWTITRHPRLHAHPAHLDSAPWPPDSDADAAQIASLSYFRTERQTFIPAPELRLAMFTIHVDVQPLTNALANPAQAQQLHNAVASMSPAVLAYRGLTTVRDRLLTWLTTQAAA